MLVLKLTILPKAGCVVDRGASQACQAPLPCLTGDTLGPQMCGTGPGFLWVLGARAQVLTLEWQVLPFKAPYLSFE